MIFSNPNDRCDLSSIPTSGPFTKFFTTLIFPKDPLLLLFFKDYAEDLKLFLLRIISNSFLLLFFACNIYSLGDNSESLFSYCSSLNFVLIAMQFVV